jgi:hypothetical protein
MNSFLVAPWGGMILLRPPLQHQRCILDGRYLGNHRVLITDAPTTDGEAFSMQVDNGAEVSQCCSCSMWCVVWRC